MGTVEERVAHVEGRVGEQALMIEGIRQAIGNLENRLDARLHGVDQRFASFEARMDHRFTTLEASVKHGFTMLDTKISRQFYWIIGIQVTLFVAITATVLSAFFASR